MSEPLWRIPQPPKPGQAQTGLSDTMQPGSISITGEAKVGSELTAPIRLSLEERIVDDTFTISRSSHVATFDADRIALPLTLRRWRAGDNFVPFGMTGRKKLSDYFSDHKFSLLHKAAAWILCDASGRILWIVGHRTDNRFRITSKTSRALIVTQG